MDSETRTPPLSCRSLVTRRADRAALRLGDATWRISSLDSERGVRGGVAVTQQSAADKVADFLVLSPRRTLDTLLRVVDEDALDRHFLHGDVGCDSEVAETSSEHAFLPCLGESSQRSSDSVQLCRPARTLR